MAFRTQKISQMTPKGADLEATDLIEVSTIESGSYVTRSITGQELIDAIPLPPTGLTVGTTPISSGTVGRVLFQGTGNVVQQSSSLFWDNTNGRFGIGTSTPSSAFQIVGSTNVEGLLNITNNTTLNFANAVNILFPNTVNGNQVAGFYIGKALSSKNGWGVSYTHSTDGSNSNRGSIDFFGVNSILNWFASGNVSINTTTDAGFRLDVNGTARVQSGLASNSSSTAFQVTGSSSSLFRIRGFGDVYLEGSTPTMYYGGSGTFVSGGSSNFYSGQGAGNAFFSVVHNNNNVAIRALSNSNVLLNPTAGNVLIGTTTDAGFRLDVNGTARVKGTGATSATVSLSIQNSAGTGALTVKDDLNVFIGNGTTGTGNSVLDQRVPRLYTFGDGSVGHYITSTLNGGTGDTSLALVGVGTGGGWFGGIRFFTSANSATPNLAMIIDRNQSVGIGLTNSTNLTVNASAILQADSTTKGFLPPRMTTTQKNAIASPATGLQVYDTTLNRPCFYDGTTWITL